MEEKWRRRERERRTGLLQNSQKLQSAPWGRGKLSFQSFIPLGEDLRF